MAGKAEVTSVSGAGCKAPSPPPGTHRLAQHGFLSGGSAEAFCECSEAQEVGRRIRDGRRTEFGGNPVGGWRRLQ